MEQKNNIIKGKIIPIIIMIIVITLCTLFVTGIISFKDNEPNNTTDNNQLSGVNDNKKEDKNKDPDNTIVDTTNYVNWMNYILNQNITSVKIERTEYVEDEDDKEQTADLTKDQLKSLFTHLMDYNLIKTYLYGSGFTYGDIITISYTASGTDYTVQIGNGVLWASSSNLKDEDLLEALENSPHAIENEEIKDGEGAYFNYRFQGYEESILDEFFN